MTTDIGRALNSLQDLSQVVSVTVLSAAAAAASAATVLAAFGVLPWLSLIVMFGDTVFEAGPFVQAGVAVMLTLLCTFFPSARRVMRIEAMRRDFTLKMDDVTRAYWMAHSADRTGVFKLSREFDAVRERLLFLRNHPDLQDLEPAVLEVAAQMSAEARELAKIYSDEKVAHAHELLEHRRAQAEEMSERISQAHGATAELRRILAEVEFDEDVVRSRAARLREELADLLPALDGPAAGGLPELRRSMIGVVPGE
jgi:chromosome segregation ATPase